MIIKGLKHTLPVILCYFPLGIIYGMLFVNQGLPGFYAPLFCLLCYSGAAQFLAISFCAIGGSFPLFALAVLSLCFRNIFYAIPLMDDYKKYPLLLRLYLAFGLVDGTFAILSLYPERDVRYVSTITFANHFSWIFGALLGVLLCSVIVLPPHLEFSLAAFFAASSVDYLLKNKTVKPLIVAGLATTFALLITKQSFFLVAASFSILFSYLAPRFQKRRVA